jgi:hypothetical protein
MTESLRKEGSAYKHALVELGRWCQRVTSNNPNVRSAVYKKLHGSTWLKSPHLRKAAYSVIANNIHAIWIQVVDDFSIQREEYTSEDLLLCVFWVFFTNGRQDHASQLIRSILSEREFMEKLDVMDVQTFMLETVTRAIYILQNKPQSIVSIQIGKG